MRLAGGAAALTGLIAAVVLLPAREPATAAVTVTIPRARAAQLVAATSGTAATEICARWVRKHASSMPRSIRKHALHYAQRFVLSGGAERGARSCLTQRSITKLVREPLEGRRAVAQVVLIACATRHFRSRFAAWHRKRNLPVSFRLRRRASRSLARSRAGGSRAALSGYVGRRGYALPRQAVSRRARRICWRR